jgi:hypothetical protein
MTQEKSFNLCKIIENMNYSQYTPFFKKVGEGLKEKMKPYKKTNPELYELGIKASTSLSKISEYFFIKNELLIKSNIDEDSIKEVAEYLCSQNYNTISKILEYLRTPLTNYLEPPSNLE